MPLLLPAPRLHRCTRCGISTVAMTCPSQRNRPGPFFIEHECFSDGEIYTFDLCSKCEWLYQDEQDGYEKTSIALGRGSPDWAAFTDAFVGLENTPLICVTDEEVSGWKAGESLPGETWLFCRNRREWYAARRLARILARDGNSPERYPRLLALLPAYKLPGGHQSTVRLECWPVGYWPSDSLSGTCDRCGRTSERLIVWKNSQWANCPECHSKMEAARRPVPEGCYEFGGDTFPHDPDVADGVDAEKGGC